MSKKVFVVDVDRCNGCHSCQIACKDEHCGTAWLPYAAGQPDTGQFWCKVQEEVHGSVPKVNITYTPIIGAQSDAIKDYAPELLMDRDDGLIVIDPEKAKGRKDLADKFEGVYWNEALEIPQGCTGCAHLIDDGWNVPRCVDACPIGGLRFGDESEFAEEIGKAEKLDPESNVYYLNLPKRWVAGQVIDDAADEVVIGAKVSLEPLDGSFEALETATDEFGDFWFRNLKEADYRLTVSAAGYASREQTASTKEADCNAGMILLEKSA
ncbi:carboxypeptidase regulatory-like domain-containing protein [Gordonibacter sp. 28C]|uniref:carboxypeptidase regulatory-like domain-containing protein n=1 Tax=Gordonibacter sp. 28C TaxID=2078569 RepID=UPI001313FCA2|nr:carboxypeptidase regulatory-like domain-containing protein [Gordonibacter sp. 28C]